MTPDLTSDAWAQIRHDYEHTDKPVQDICLEHGTTSNTLRDRVRRWGWTPRRLPIPAEGPPPTPAPQIDHAAPLVPIVAQIDTAAPSQPDAPGIEPAPGSAVPHVAGSDDAPAEPAQIARRLQGAIARVLPAIEATLATLAARTTHPREMERAARALGALTRTLRELKTLLGQHGVPDDKGHANLDEFRRELARKMDAVIAAGRERRDDGAEPEGT
jgi:hypothetical protein